MLAVADDLTGAAEIAAIGHRAGWRAEVVTRPDDFGDADLTVLDTDTRLAPPAVAAQTVAAAGALAAQRAWRLVYKKTDSVLRGAVLAEVTALASALKRRTILLVPSNPSLGRVTRGGRYFVNDVPLDQTAFARDPHHPAHTAVVADLLRWSALSPTRFQDSQAPSNQRVGGNALHLPETPLHVLPPGSPLPASGVIVGEAASSDDVRSWAARVDENTLPAGGGEFFATVLQIQLGAGPRAVAPFAPVPPTLLVCGSTAAPRQAAGAITLPREIVGSDDRAAATQWTAEVVAKLSTRPFVAVRSPIDRSADARAPARIRDAFALLVRQAIEQRAVRHLMIEGGATASSILAALGWTRLAVAREWSQGVVTLRPAVAEEVCVTMKPGSYHWPAALWTHVQAPA